MSDNDSDIGSIYTATSAPSTFASSTVPTTSGMDEDGVFDSRHSEFGRPPSPAPSIFSITHSLREELFTFVHGRFVNNNSQVYQLPADEEEIDRLDRQHQLFKMLLGQNYLGPVAEVLREEEGIQKDVLDLGCGSTIWAVEMAQEFPHCNVVGVDLAPPLQADPPPNCRIEVDDINLGLEHFYGSFDLIHARLISAGIKDYYGLLDDISKCLRPNGMFLAVDWDYRLCDPTKSYTTIYPRNHPKHAWLPRFIRAMNVAVRSRMGNIDAVALLPQWLKEHRSFEAVGQCDVWIPCGPYFSPDTEAGKRMNTIGRLMALDILSFISAGRPLLLESGMPEDEVDELLTNAHRETDQAHGEFWLKLAATWGRKKLETPSAPI
ncbi:hypothetical protein BOTBODRAFT_180480 [Botryobasidium botryosum FD-172 SS1]|uniref:Methyltransferase domain-containing protein n=1 Tax=Botryobasidium botryosum (strain FD-172 SS1) TaxID=930990 RepID=A0A067LZA2_BOTB1|nr:hypothetical protein BOTBODRAFT_180480 [Botryobasidium botryosum FD-172 SS1]